MQVVDREKGLMPKPLIFEKHGSAGYGFHSTVSFFAEGRKPGEGMLSIAMYGDAQYLDDSYEQIRVSLDRNFYSRNRNYFKRLQDAIDHEEIPHLVDNAHRFHEQIRIGQEEFFGLNMPTPKGEWHTTDEFVVNQGLSINGAKYRLLRLNNTDQLRISKQRQGTSPRPDYLYSFPFDVSKFKIDWFGGASKPSLATPAQINPQEKSLEPASSASRNANSP